MYYPTLEDVKKYKGDGNLVPICREIVADLETPVSTFLKINRGGYSFLLESVEGGEKMARYSFLGADPYMIFRSRGLSGTIRDLNTGLERRFEGDPITDLRNVMACYKSVGLPGLPRFTGGGV